MSRDMMPAFELYQPTSVDDALDLLDRAGEGGWLMAGGMDSLDWFKDRIKRPTAVIDISGIAEMHGVREIDGGVEIGALTTLTQVETDPIITDRYRLLADAAGKVASPQIRNAGTIGGNVGQDARCWYYRSGLNCYRAGGNTCYADTPTAMNREHTLFGASRCVAVTPSDTAVALTSLDAEMVIRGPDGERVVPATEFFIGPAVDITRMTVLEPGDILTAIRVPETWAGAHFYFEKVTDRNTWDFPLVNVAAAIRLEGGAVQDLRLTCGGVECVPHRLPAVEDSVKGEPLDEEIIDIAARFASRGARPLNYNHFKIPLMENLVKRALRSAIA